MLQRVPQFAANCFLLALLLLAPVLSAQTSVSPPAQQPSSYSLKVQSRLVIEDVSVLDRQGNAVVGLPASAFHVVDNNVPQTVRDFQELRASDVAPSAGAMPPSQDPTRALPTNATLFRNHATVVALLIDPSTMSLEEQMYLRIQALRFVDAAPDTTSMSVFRVNSSGIPVLLQSLTQNKAELRAAVSTALPTLTRPNGGHFLNAIAELENISEYLRAVPGRKAVLWLAGAFPLYQPPDYGGLCSHGATCGNRPTGLHLSAEQDAYRALEEARVAVYPIDVRGVQMGGLSAVAVVDRGPGSVPGDAGAKPTSETEGVTGQYDEMDLLANATGGRAFYSDNDVAQILGDALRLTTEGYTLAYHPRDEAADGKWHTVTVRVDGPYTVRYRRGYYAASTPPAQLATTRHIVSAAGGAPAPPSVATLVGPAGKPDDNSSPIIFSARVLSEHKPGRIDVRYVIPTDQLLFDGESSGHAHFRLAALAYDAEGDVLSHAMEIVDTRYTAEQMSLATRIGLPADQTLEVNKGAKYLLLAVEDLRSGKVGTVQLPLSQVSPAGGGASGTTPSDTEGKR